MRLTILCFATLMSWALPISTVYSQQLGTGTTQGTGTDAATQQQQLSESAGQITGNERFLRENREAGAVVGAGNAGAGLLGGGNTANQAQPQTGGNQGRFGAGGSPFSPFNQFNNFNQLYGAAAINQLSNQRAQLRMPVSLGFQPRQQSLITPAVREQRIQARFARIPRVREMGSVSVDIREGTAILSGAVGSEDDRRLLAKLLLLEPGVSEVQNDLTVLDQPPALTLPPAN